MTRVNYSSFDRLSYDKCLGDAFPSVKPRGFTRARLIAKKACDHR